MIENITDNWEIIGGVILAIVGGGVFFSYKKSKKITMTNIKTKSGDVVAGDKTTHN